MVLSVAGVDCMKCSCMLCYSYKLLVCCLCVRCIVVCYLYVMYCGMNRVLISKGF